MSVRIRSYPSAFKLTITPKSIPFLSLGVLARGPGRTALSIEGLTQVGPWHSIETLYNAQVIFPGPVSKLHFHLRSLGRLFDIQGDTNWRFLQTGYFHDTTLSISNSIYSTTLSLGRTRSLQLGFYGKTRGFNFTLFGTTRFVFNGQMKFADNFQVLTSLTECLWPTATLSKCNICLRRHYMNGYFGVGIAFPGRLSGKVKYHWNRHKYESSSHIAYDCRSSQWKVRLSFTFHTDYITPSISELNNSLAAGFDPESRL
jgi:hypothetical protein